MFPDLPMWTAILFVVVGLVALAWSADKFVDGSSALARAMGVSPLVIGMVIIGFGTSAPELFVSVLSGSTGHSDLSLGNAYGSCVFNIAVILGIASLIHPLAVKPSVTFGAVPVLVGIALFSCLLVGLGDGFTRLDGILTLAVFAVVMPLYCWLDQRGKRKTTNATPPPVQVNRLRAAFDVVLGLAVLVGSSHILVWGSVDLARSFGVSELMIGLTIVAAGTSLPELASAVASARRGKHEFVLGNIIGSNIFNTLAVVGLAGTIEPFGKVSPYLLQRDMSAMVALSFSIALFGVNWRNWRKRGRITRWEGALWILSFLVYFAFMLRQEMVR